MLAIENEGNVCWLRKSYKFKPFFPCVLIIMPHLNLLCYWQHSAVFMLLCFALFLFSIFCFAINRKWLLVVTDFSCQEATSENYESERTIIDENNLPDRLFQSLKANISPCKSIILKTTNFTLTILTHTLFFILIFVRYRHILTNCLISSKNFLVYLQSSSFQKPVSTIIL